MKKVKRFSVLVLILLSVISFSILAVQLESVTITSKGKASATSFPDGSITFGCDNSDNVTCTITIKK